MTNEILLEEKIANSGFKKSYIAEKMGITMNSLKRKIRNQNEFKASEMNELCDILGIRAVEERKEIFFTEEVDLKSTM